MRLISAAPTWAQADIERLRAFTASLPFDPELAETWMQKFRDDARY